MIIAIDVGGTKTLITTFTDEGQIGNVTRLKTPHDSDSFIATISSILIELHPQPTDILTIACPGRIDCKQGIVLYSPNLHWKNFHLKEQLATHVACSIYLENDAHLAALGATRALQTTPQLALYITIGTGIGSGIILRGKLDPAFSRSESGHMLFETSEGLEEWETFASGRSITETYGRLAANITDINDWHDITDRLVTGFRVLIPALQPDIILIGGGVGVQFEHFGSYLKEQLKKQLPDFIPVPPIEQAKNPDEVVLYGCYYYATDVLGPTAAA